MWVGPYSFRIRGGPVDIPAAAYLHGPAHGARRTFDVAVEVADRLQVEDGPDLQVRGVPGTQEWSAMLPGVWAMDTRGHRIRTRVSANAGAGAALLSSLRFFSAELLARNGGLALHAAAVVSGDKAAVMMARSGGGKTTAALAMGREGILADDFCIIGPGPGGETLVWPSPFPGREHTKVTGRAVRLGMFAELVKDETLRLEKDMDRPGAVACLLAHCVLFVKDVRARQGLLDTVLALAFDYPVARLHLGPGDDALELLQQRMDAV